MVFPILPVAVSRQRGGEGGYMPYPEDFHGTGFLQVVPGCFFLSGGSVRVIKEILPKNLSDVRKNYAKDNNRIKPQKNSGKPLFFPCVKWYNNG